MMLRSFLLTLALSLPASLSASVLDRFSDVVVFGDSLSDPVVPELAVLAPGFYPNQQVTNGDTWAVQLGLDDPAFNNFAQSGARALSDGTDDFAEQIAAFAGTGRILGDSALAMVWFGGNDIADATLIGATDPAAAVARAGQAIGAIIGGMEQLIAAGFDKAIIFLSPRIGETPQVSQLGAAVSAAANGLSDLYNSQLLTIGSFLSRPIDLAFVDVPALVANVQANAPANGFTNLTDACLTPVSFCGADLNGYFYYDPFHPTDRVHGIVAQAASVAATSIAPVPLPASALLLLSGLAALTLRRKSWQVARDKR